MPGALLHGPCVRETSALRPTVLTGFRHTIYYIHYKIQNLVFQLHKTQFTIKSCNPGFILNKIGRVKAAGSREPEFIGGEVDLRINIYRGQVNGIQNADTAGKAPDNCRQTADSPPTDCLQTADKPPENRRQTARKPPTNCRQTAGKPPENRRKTAEKPPENHQKTAGKPPENRRKTARKRTGTADLPIYWKIVPLRQHKQ